jgi:hypothetical protein
MPASQAAAVVHLCVTNFRTCKTAYPKQRMSVVIFLSENSELIKIMIFGLKI